MLTNIFLIRHGETDWNQAGRFQGQIDIPLNDRGIWQAKQLVQRFVQKRLDLLISSDLKRAYETASIVANNLKVPHRSYPALRERSYGHIEGKTREELEQLYPERPGDLAEISELNVEPLTQMQERFVKQIEEIVRAYPNKNIGVVSHGGAINAFLSFITKGEHGTGKTRLNNCSISHLVYDGENWQVICLNDVQHFDI